MIVTDEFVMPDPIRGILQPERILYFHIIHDAMRDLNSKRHFAAAYRWLTNPHGHGSLVTLARCCEILGIDADAISRAVVAGRRLDRRALIINGLLTKVGARS